MKPEDVIAGLVARGVPLAAAQGIAANLMAESGLNPGINERNPVVPGSRGGFGFAQWTGPRRRQYEAFAAQRGVKLDDPQAQLDFLVWEGQNTEKSAWNATLSAPDATAAAKTFSDQFLRPGVPNMGNRLALASQYAGLAPGNAGGAAPQPGNALAPPMFQYAMVQNDPAAFMRPRNALALQPFQTERRNMLGSLT